MHARQRLVCYRPLAHACTPPAPARDVTDPLVEVRGVGVTFPRGVEALRDVSFALGRGEAVALVGPSGCGKSTVLRLLAGLVRPSHGTVTVDGMPPAVARGRGAGIGMVFQHPTLLAWRTVLANVVLPLELGGGRGADGRERARNLLSRVGLAEFADAHPRELSGGMQMRVALARALVADPMLLLLDEPFAALDALTREELQDELLDLRTRQPISTVLVTHDAAEAVLLADRVLVMHARPGRIMADVSVPFTERSPALRHDTRFAALAAEVAARLRARSS